MTQGPPRLLLMTLRPRSGVYPSGVAALFRVEEGGGGALLLAYAQICTCGRVFMTLFIAIVIELRIHLLNSPTLRPS